MAAQTTPSIDPQVVRLAGQLAPYKRLPKREYRALALWASNFYPFQREWLFEDTRFAIANKSRQIGLSHSAAGASVIWGAYHGETTTIISVGQDEADEVLVKCQRHVDVLRALGSENANTLKSNTSEIVFSSGGRIIALPQSGGRSFTGNVVLDEFGYQTHASKVWDAAAPVAMLGFKIRVLSTPNGVGNDFHDLWEIATNAERREKLPEAARHIVWKPHEIPLQLAMDQGYPVDIAECWALAKGDPRLFEQMFNCSFLDNVLQYIPDAIIRECAATWDGIPPMATSGGEYFAGLDIAREADLTVLLIIHRANDGICRVVHIESMRRTDSDELEAMVARAFTRYKIARLCIDATGMGSFPADRIKKQWSERIDVAHRRPRVEPIDFTPNSKEAMATGLYDAMTNGILRIPDSDVRFPAFPSGPNTANEAGSARKLQLEIAAIRRVISQSGNVLYTTPRTNEGHADRAWALMLAMHARTAVNPMLAALRERVSGIKVVS